ncbi:MAG: phospholipase D-like domain-containing protein [Clostridium sp.]|nr:phospholipase D-like domain-containing protein [Clostridium sp.]
MNLFIFLGSILFVLDMTCVISIIFIENRDTTTTWAWLLILLMFPFLGFILYLCLGQNISKEKIFKKKAFIDKYKLINSLNIINSSTSNRNGLSSENLSLIKMNLNTNGSFYTNNNGLKIYTNGVDKFNDLIQDIKHAEKFINIEYYIFRFDKLGSYLIDILSEKVKEGIEVRLLVDGMGSSSLTKKQHKYISDQKIKFSIFFPSLFSYINLRLNYRNHRKIVVIDNKIGYVGGFNVGDEYVNEGKQFSFWRDTHLRLTGDSVYELNKRFTLDWQYAAKEDIDMSQNCSSSVSKDHQQPISHMFFHEVNIHSETDSNVRDNPSDISMKFKNVGMQIISSGPDNLEEYIRNTYLKIISNAKKYVYIQTPYLVLDEPMIVALKIAAFSGIDVRIMVPDKADHFFMKYALSSSIGTLINSGVKFYKYKKGFIHSKTIVSDNMISSIGTANLDIRSFKLNFEINAVIYDSSVAESNTDIFLKDIQDCYLLTINEYKKRSISIKICESLVRLVFPIL